MEAESKMKTIAISQESRRRGFTMLEAMVATVILMTVMAVSTKMVLTVIESHRTMQMHRLAGAEITNRIEQLRLVPFSELETAASEPWTLSPDAVQRLKNAQCSVTVEPAENDGKLLRVSVDWMAGASEGRRTESLSFWRFGEADKKAADADRVVDEEPAAEKPADVTEEKPADEEETAGGDTDLPDESTDSVSATETENQTP